MLCHANVDVTKLDPLEEYNIVCIPMFEATIIASSTDAGVSSNHGSAAIGNGVYTWQEGTYCCTDSELVRITKLHSLLARSCRPPVALHCWLKFGIVCNSASFKTDTNPTE